MHSIELVSSNTSKQPQYGDPRICRRVVNPVETFLLRGDLINNGFPGASPHPFGWGSGQLS